MTVTATGPVPLDYPAEWPPGSGVRGPNPRQVAAHALAAHVDELLYGGARGGGKTDFLLAEQLRRAFIVPGHQGVFFRRTYAELSGPGGAISRLLQRIPRSLGRYNASERRWAFSNGSSLFLSYLENLGDVQRWLGLEIQHMSFDQVEQLDEETYVLVRSSLRATGPTAAGMAAAGLRPSSSASANPGGRGHVWVKRRWIDPFPAGEVAFRAAPSEDEPTPMVRVFVPAKLDDNPALALGDPTYRARLQALSADDRKAMLEGDWNVFKGARFGAFRTAVHVRRLELPPPGTHARGRGIDYGSDNPFVCLWGVSLADDWVHVYRELVVRGLSPVEQARAVAAAQDAAEARALPPAALDPACWAAPPDKPLPRTGGQAVRPTGPPPGSIADRYVEGGVDVVRADNRRVEGAADVAARLTVRPDGNPRLTIDPSCTYLIETLPAQQRARLNPEDVEKGSTDHAYDALRYLLAQLRGATLDAPEPPSREPGPGLRVRPGERMPSGAALPEASTTWGLRRRGF